MKVLIVKTSSMGDLIHTLPAVTDACKAISGIHFDWVSEESFKEIPGWHPGVDKVIPVALRRWRKNISRAIYRGEINSAVNDLRSREYDKIIDAQGLIKSAILTKVTKGTHYGMDRYSCREPLASYLYQKKIPVEKGLHAIDRVRLLFSRALGYEYDSQYLDYGLNRNDFGTSNSQSDYLVFLHATSWKTKQWAVENWIMLAKFASGQGYKVLLPWGNDAELKRAKVIKENANNAIVLPKLTLGAVAEILANASVIVGLDTGLAHLGAALNIPGITLYIATSPKLTGALGHQQTCLSMHQGNGVSENQAVYPGTDYINQITPEIVWNTVEKKLL